MKIFPLFFASLLPACGFLRAELISNGGFEDQSLGTKLELPAPDGGSESTAFTDWRVYNATPPTTAFTATIIDNASEGTKAMRLDVDNTNGAGQNWGLDQANCPIPVAYGKKYNFQFEAAHIMGDPGLVVAISEYDATPDHGGYLGQTLYFFNVTDTAYQSFSVPDWTPKYKETTRIDILFRPHTIGRTVSLSLDNVQFDALP